MNEIINKESFIIPFWVEEYVGELIPLPIEAKFLHIDLFDLFVVYFVPFLAVSTVRVVVPAVHIAYMGDNSDQIIQWGSSGRVILLNINWGYLICS